MPDGRLRTDNARSFDVLVVYAGKNLLRSKGLCRADSRYYLFSKGTTFGYMFQRASVFLQITTDLL